MASSLWAWVSSPSSRDARMSKDEPSSPSSPGSSSSAVPVRLDWAAASSAEPYVPRLLDARGSEMHSHLLSPFALRQLAEAVPKRFAYADWRLLYSTAEHGISLNTFYSRSAGCGCCLLAIKDVDGHVFGAFCTEWREPSTPSGFYGGGETFMYSIERVDSLPPLPVGEELPPNEAVHVHRWSGANTFFMFSSRDHLAMGSGGHFALYLDADLLHGSSGPSETFGNACLCRQRPGGVQREDDPPVGEFRCDVLEVWGMDHAAISRRQQELMMRGLRSDSRSFRR